MYFEGAEVAAEVSDGGFAGVIIGAVVVVLAQLVTEVSKYVMSKVDRSHSEHDRRRASRQITLTACLEAARQFRALLREYRETAVPNQALETQVSESRSNLQVLTHQIYDDGARTAMTSWFAITNDWANEVCQDSHESTLWDSMVSSCGECLRKSA